MGSCLVLDRQEELEFRRKLLLGVEPIRKVNPSNPAVCVNLHPQGLDVVRSVRPPREVGQVELDLVPPLVKSHWHCTNERFHSRCGLVVGGPKSAAHVLVIKHLHFEAKILLEILDDHDKEGKLDAQGPAKREKSESMGKSVVRMPCQWTREFIRSRDAAGAFLRLALTWLDQQGM